MQELRFRDFVSDVGKRSSELDQETTFSVLNGGV